MEEEAERMQEMEGGEACCEQLPAQDGCIVMRNTATPLSEEPGNAYSYWHLMVAGEGWVIFFRSHC